MRGEWRLVRGEGSWEGIGKGVSAWGEGMG